MGLGLEEFDRVFAYPWPDEEALIEGLFEGHGRAGAMLLTYHADGALRLRRLTMRDAILRPIKGVLSPCITADPPAEGKGAARVLPGSDTPVHLPAPGTSHLR
jgi:hypothetical protein